MIDIMHEAVNELLLAEFEKHPDLHEWIGPSDDRPCRFELSHQHRLVGKERKECWRLMVFDAYATAYAGPQFAAEIDVGDPLFPRKAISWLREQRAYVPERLHDPA